MEENLSTIPQMVEEVRAGKLRRRTLIAALVAMGLSAAGIEAIIAAIRSAPARPTAKPAAPQDHQQQHHLIQQHNQHLANQTQGNTDGLENDYAENAIVEDSMHAHPFVGREAIMSRKRVGLNAIPNLQIDVTNRLVQQNQLTVEWVARGIHTGNFAGLPASGRSFTIPGVTVVVRENGKIIRESIYYDTAEVYRQLGAQ
ncbi:MAG TPA: ester cyclase [Ktedonobacteraceae bacterium]|nr:ester cyclase [Ktedonobacteraceae bacterium]